MAAERRLAKYDSMRDFAKSPEPPGKVAGSADGRNRFLVQRHRARRLHYDLRFEVDGVLVSWAVPRGPNLDPARKSLAVKVEDHPYAYGWFEGIIPSGYGMGDVVLWDDGWWEPDPEYPDEPAAAKAIESGEFKFMLVGRKLRGRFVLIRTSKPGEADDQWLLMKKKDDTAVPGWDPEDYPRSVLSARTNEDIAEGRPGRWRAATADELATLRKLPSAKGLGGAQKSTAEWSVAGVTQQITNLDKVLIPGRGKSKPITKREIIAYYATVAPWMTMGLAGHPDQPQPVPGRHRRRQGRLLPQGRADARAAVGAPLAEPQGQHRRDARVPPDRRRPGAGRGWPTSPDSRSTRGRRRRRRPTSRRTPWSTSTRGRRRRGTTR